MRKYLIWGVILVAALLLRTYRLDKAPLELFGDELDVGYQAYSVLKTGRDLRGFKLPLYFHSLSESRAPVYLYAAVPFIAVFGLNEWGVRLPAVIFGVLNIFLLAVLVKNIFNDEKLALISAVVLTFLPWHLQYSRASFEVTLLLTLILAGVIFFKKALTGGKGLPLASFLFVLSLYTYSTAVLFTPLLVIYLIFTEIRGLKKVKLNQLLVTAMVLILGFLPLLINTLGGQSQERFSRISLFSDQKLVEKIILKRSSENGGGRLFHNKVTEIGKQFLNNYLTVFSPQFLFLEGDPNPRHSSGGTGEIYLFFLPFLFWGGLTLVKNWQEKASNFVLFWLLISPIPSALTIGGGNHATRLFIMILPLVILISLGLVNFFKFINKRKSYSRFIPLGLFSLLFFTNLIFYFHQYYVHYPVESWQFWNYGYKEVVKELAKVEDDYSRVVLNNAHEPALIRLLFWGKIDPGWFHQNFNSDKEEPGILPGFNGFRVGKYYFGRLQEKDDLSKILDKDTLYLAFQEDEIPGDWDWQASPPENIIVLKMIKNPIGKPYLYLLTGKN